MKKIFISGATGYIGSKLANRLAEEGHEVHALYRSDKKAGVLKHPGIKLFKGDIMDPKSIDRAISGCSQVYHVAAFARVWTPDLSSIYHLNIDGAVNVISSAHAAGVERIVLTSTAGVLGSSGKDKINENASPDTYFVHYEHSKAILEKIARTFCQAGLDIVIVNPSRVYGPGILSQSNGVTRMIHSYIRGMWRIIPGRGNSIGNYVYIDDVVKGHMLAMEKGKPGERYILGGENVSYNEFFHKLGLNSGRKYRMIRLPYFMMLIFSYLVLFSANIFRFSPMIIPGLVKKYNKDFRLDISRAQKELGYKYLYLEEGFARTIDWLRDKRYK